MNQSLADGPINTMGSMAFLPENFMMFSEDKKKRWFQKLRNPGNDFKVLNLSVTKKQALQIDDNFLKLMEKYCPLASIVIDSTWENLYTTEEFKKIAGVREGLNRQGNELIFTEFRNFFGFDMVCEANNKLNSWADEINSAKIDGKSLSPLEKYYLAYNFVTQFKYNEVKNEVGSVFSRSLISVLTGNKIVCVGYAQLLSALCKRLGIECEPQEISYNQLKPNHMNCCVRLKDEKYGVSGVYYSDPCFDCLDENGRTSLANSLISFGDIKKLFQKETIHIDIESETGRRIKFDDRKDFSVEKLKGDMSAFLSAEEDGLLQYFDKVLKDEKDKVFITRPTKSDIHDIIDCMIENYLAKKYRMSHNNDTSETLRYSKPKYDISDSELAQIILRHSKKSNISELKNLIADELKTYVPDTDTYTFEVLSDCLTEKIKKDKSAEIDREKAETKDLTMEQFEKLVQNLEKVEGSPKVESIRNMSQLIANSVIRANDIWGEFRFGKNVFSALANTYTIEVRDHGFSRVRTGKDILEMHKKRFSHIENNQLDK